MDHEKQHETSIPLPWRPSCHMRFLAAFGSDSHRRGNGIEDLEAVMGLEKSPAFRFYADDFLAGCHGMSAEEVGCYIRLLCFQWTKGHIPNQQDAWQRYAGAMPSPYVMSKFEACGRDGRELKNRRLEQERRKQEEFRITRSNAGRKGAAKLWSSHDEAKAKDGIPLPLPLPLPATSKEVGGAQERKASKTNGMTDSAWLESLSKNKAYTGIDVQREFAKAETWIAQKPRRKLTRMFFINWLNRAEAPMAVNNGSGKAVSSPPTVYGLTKIIEAKRSQAADLFNQHATETGLSTTWTDEPARLKYRELKLDIKQLTAKLGSIQT